jgi:hypothetical protein
VLIGAALLSLCFIILWLWLFLNEWVYATRVRRQKKRDQKIIPC